MSNMFTRIAGSPECMSDVGIFNISRKMHTVVWSEKLFAAAMNTC